MAKPDVREKAKNAVVATVQLLERAQAADPHHMPESLLPGKMTSQRLERMTTQEVINYGFRLAWGEKDFWRTLPSAIDGQETTIVLLDLRTALKPIQKGRS